MTTAPTSSDPELRLDEIVLTAAGLDSTERAEYLRTIAATDRDLATRAAQRLDAAADLPDSFLETPAAERLDEAEHPADTPISGAGIPPEARYTLGKSLGAGGMGRVVVAFDRQLRRRIALKFLTNKDEVVLRLFLAEAQAQARVRHPHVLEVYDSGELGGEPFIAMRYVEGGTLAEIGPTLTLERRLELLYQAAEGLHAAHREGLLHRDVKPSNILVERMPDGQLAAMVADFGLATEFDEADDETTDDALAGSPYYIAPERLDGESGPLDRRSDVYSLGVTMYRSLTGTLPFEARNTFDVLRQVISESPIPARQHRPDLPAEIEAIVMRAIARDPSQRYASARAVAEDLRRYLDGEVVEAYAAGIAYRLTRFALRNRLLVATTGLAAAALLAASVVVAIFAVKADAARHRAELRQTQAEELIRFMVVDLRAKLEPLGRLDILDDVGGAATEYFAAVPANALSEAELLRRSRMLYQLGDVRIQQGDLVGAADPLAESLALAKRLVALRPDDRERRFELGQSHFWVGFVHWQLGDLVAARAPFERYLEISRRLVTEEPNHLVWQRELSYAHSNLGSLLQAEGDLEGALERFRSAQAIDEALLAIDPDSLQAQSELAATHNTLGVTFQALGRLDDAARHLEADLTIRLGVLMTAPENRRWRDRLATSQSRLAEQRAMQGDWMAAETLLETARDHFDALIEHDPANVSWRLKLAWIYLRLGRAAFVRQDFAAADAAWTRQRALIDALLDRDDTPHAWRRTQAVGLYHQALFDRARGRDTTPTIDAAVARLESLAIERPSDRDVHRWLSQCWIVRGQAGGPNAEAAFVRAADALEPFVHAGRDPRLLAPWATALACLGRDVEARTARGQLTALGYVEPGLDAPCPSPR